MKIPNHRVLNQLSAKILKTSKNRNIMAVLAIALTTLLFTSIFTIAFSLNDTYQSYSFRQIGGYAHGSFKKINEAQKTVLLKSPHIKAHGIRTAVGYIQEGAFAKYPAEVNCLDANTAQWSYIHLLEGKLPQKENEVVMDTAALKQLGVEARLGTKVPLTFELNNADGVREKETKDFVLSGYFQEDTLLKVHSILVSDAYVAALEKRQIAKGFPPFTSEMEVMLHSTVGIEKQMKQILTEQGLSEDSVAIGVNWGYTTSQFAHLLDAGTVAFMLLLIAVVILVGYLIIHNIFQISVAADIRLYGLLKTIGFTGKQLQKIILKQALLLCIIGIPIGILIGYALGGVLTPFIIQQLGMDTALAERSMSALIFGLSILFALCTVVIACLKPARYAGKVSPIDATKYVDCDKRQGSHRKTKGATALHLALATIGRRKKRTILVIVSIALSFVLLNMLTIFVGGFSMDKYLEKKACADFIVSSPDYFNFTSGNISQQDIQYIQANTSASRSGTAYRSRADAIHLQMTAQQWEDYSSQWPKKFKQNATAFQERKDGTIACGVNIEGMDEALINKLHVVEGTLKPYDEQAIALVIETDDYGNPIVPQGYPKINEPIQMDYTLEMQAIDTRTGKLADEETPQEFVSLKPLKQHSVNYVVCAYVTVPYAIGARYSDMRLKAVLPAERLAADSQGEIDAIFYAFDTAGVQEEQEAERFLKQLSESNTQLMYESKGKLRQEFNHFKNIFSVIGGLLCVIIIFVGVLNYFNTLMTSFFARKREFAMLQAVGMTGKQLKKLLIYESSVYLLSAMLLSMAVSTLLFTPLNALLEKIFWFYSGHFTLTPILAFMPLFFLLGISVPCVLYWRIKQSSIIERIRA